MQLPSDGNIFTARPEQLAELLAGINNHTIALPNFQRAWVWEPEMVRDLLVSGDCSGGPTIEMAGSVAMWIVVKPTWPFIPGFSRCIASKRWSCGGPSAVNRTLLSCALTTQPEIRSPPISWGFRPNSTLAPPE